MTYQITKLVSALTIAIVTLFASQANADIYNHIDRSALTIQEKTKVLMNETIHYRHTPEYGKLVVCTNKLRKAAKHIHEVTHFKGNLVNLCADLQILNHEFQLLAGFFDDIERRASYGQRRIAGNTAHVKELLDCMEDAIQLVQLDVDQLLAARPTTVRRPVYVPPTKTITRTVIVPSRPVYTPSRPVYVPTRPAVNIQINSKGNSGRGVKKGYGNSRGNKYGRSYGNSSRGRSGGVGFSIGGGSSKIQIRF